jgi:co-chaperonin GroES (HSP10)
MKIKPLRSRVLASSCEIGARTTESGVHLLDDDGKEAGIRPRWFHVEAIGPEQKDVSLGQYILVSHGRWTWATTVYNTETNESIKDIRMIDETDILGVSGDRPKELDQYEGNT